LRRRERVQRAPRHREPSVGNDRRWRRRRR
jgi:hypothetical protein